MSNQFSTRQLQLATLIVAGIWAAAISPRGAQSAEPLFLGRNQYQWVQSLEAGASRRQRSHAAWALAQFSAEQAKSPDTMKWLNELFQMTEHDSPTVRYWGIWGIRRFVVQLEPKHPAREPALSLLTELLDHNTPAVEVAAAEALAHLGRPERGLPILIAALKDPQESLRIQSATALEGLGEAARPAEAALRAATGDSSEYVKRISSRAVEALAAGKAESR